jgi:hypothetical protein
MLLGYLCHLNPNGAGWSTIHCPSPRGMKPASIANGQGGACQPKQNGRKQAGEPMGDLIPGEMTGIQPAAIQSVVECTGLKPWEAFQNARAPMVFLT